MPRLVPDLEAQFIKHEICIETRRFVKPGVLAERPIGPYTDDDFEARTGPVEGFLYVDTLAEADGVWLLCPKCFVDNSGSIGTHAVICWFVDKVSDDVDPKPGRWTPTGTGLVDLTFVPSPGRSHSVLLTGGCRWHGFVADGAAA